MYATVYKNEKGDVVSNTEDGTEASAVAFNSAQRGHQNALETLPSVLALTLVGGLFNPVAAAASLLAWSVGADAYSRQYCAGGPSARNKGLPMMKYAGLLALLVINARGAWTAALTLL